MKNPKISVVMLIHNREKYVGQAIESILSQTFGGFDFIIVDNESTDASRLIAEEYQKKDGRIRIIKNDSANIGSGRNLGLTNATGEYFTFIDDDDYARPDYLKTLLTLAERYDADIAVCGSEYDFAGEIRPKYVFDETVLCSRDEAVEYFLLRKYFNSGNPTKLFRRTQAISDVRFLETGRYDDIHTMYRFFCAASREKHTAVAALGRPLYVFRRTAANNSRATLEHSSITPAWLDEYLSAYARRTRYIRQTIPCLSEVARYSELSFMISMVEKIHRLRLGDCLDHLENMTRELASERDEFMKSRWTRDFEREWMEAYIER